ncbi:A disintegrin and metalloproteinase with thrombospondin motifs 10-like [Rhincodon typus]|uniref:A disintegrin and metalloproteinase with thrombospondin motifs 10-like n=1 Tax=Rhincodon typus TaxID=259920 RepID=UPI0020307DDD|nr:A disintegrin and metalloproteinase with thrombospondin motifs 10-like [Rhincodon typus]
MFILQARAWLGSLLLNVTVFRFVVQSQLIASDRRRMELTSGSKWSPWQSWSPCSSTCGGGVATRVRRCLISHRHPFGKPCPGNQRQYKVCAAEDCPPGTMDFRELQCAAYNGHRLSQIQGAVFEWIPFYGGASGLCTAVSCATVEDFVLDKELSKNSASHWIVHVVTLNNPMCAGDI